MAGPQADEIDWVNMTKKELHDKFQQMLSQQVEDVVATFGKALERIDDVEKIIDTKLDAKFDEVLAHLPQPPPVAPVAPLQQQQQQHLQRRLSNQVVRAHHVPIEPGQNSGAAAPTVDAYLAPARATAGAEEDGDYAGNYEDEVDQNQNYVQPPPPPLASRP